MAKSIGIGVRRPKTQDHHREAELVAALVRTLAMVLSEGSPPSEKAIEEACALAQSWLPSYRVECVERAPQAPSPARPGVATPPERAKATPRRTTPGREPPPATTKRNLRAERAETTPVPERAKALPPRAPRASAPPPDPPLSSLTDRRVLHITPYRPPQLTKKA